MRRRWSAREIRRAIHILDLCAGTRDLCGSAIIPELSVRGQRANRLAWLAFDAAPLHDDSWSATYAEAAGMLRDGWLPGDPVIRHA